MPKPRRTKAAEPDGQTVRSVFKTIFIVGVLGTVGFGLVEVLSLRSRGPTFDDSPPEGRRPADKSQAKDGTGLASEPATVAARPWLSKCSPAVVELNKHREQTPTVRQCCPAVARDIDKGYTMQQTIARILCSMPREVDASGAPRRVRVVQVGANTGDNENDHLVRYLRTNHAQAVLLEPVPWVFKRLRTTYARAGRVVAINAAMSTEDGNVSFTAPKERARGWMPQMGGIKLPPKTYNKLKKQGGLANFEKINVRSVMYPSLLKAAGFDNPHIFVVDAEGYDDVIMHHVLDHTVGPATHVDHEHKPEADHKEKAGHEEGHDTHDTRRKAQATDKEDTEHHKDAHKGEHKEEGKNGDKTSAEAKEKEGHHAEARHVPGRPIPVLQYEWKHLKEDADARLVARLTAAGYCVRRVHYDTLAYHTATVAPHWPERCSASFTWKLTTS